MCGRRLDPRAPVHHDNPGFDTCPECEAVLGGFPLVEPQPNAPARALASATTRPVTDELAVARPPAEPRRTGSWRMPAGWVRLDEQPVLHQPHPERLDRVMCGRVLDVSVPVHKRRPGHLPTCDLCRTVRAKTLERQRATARERRRVARAAEAQPRRTPEQRASIRQATIGSLRAPGWVVLCDRGGRVQAHRTNPERPGRVMCGRVADASLPVQRRPPIKTTQCQRCLQRLHRARLAAGLDTEHVRDPDELDRRDRARARGTSIRTVSGGLPTLGRDR